MLSGAALVAGISTGSLLCAKRTSESISILQEQNKVREEYSRLEDGLFIMESTTYATLHYYIGDGFYNRNRVISIPKMYIPRDISAKELSDLEKEISQVPRLHTITQFKFDEQNFREAYRAVEARFDKISSQEALRFSFSDWKAKAMVNPLQKSATANPQR